MYINDVHILYYVLFGILGLLVGGLVNWCNIRLPEYKKIFSLEILKKREKISKYNFITSIVMAVIYIGLLYKFGINSVFINNINLIKFLILSPMLVSAFCIDYKLQIIPNRLNLTMFEIGMIFTVIYGIYNINIAINMLLGMVAGAGMFLLITLLGGAIAGKEAMGFGDVKLMGALGLYFGLVNIVVITIVAFLLSAIISIILMITKVRKINEYIPFGPFIVMACFVNIFVPFDVLLFALLKIFTLGMYS